MIFELDWNARRLLRQELADRIDNHAQALTAAMRITPDGDEERRINAERDHYNLERCLRLLHTVRAQDGPHPTTEADRYDPADDVDGDATDTALCADIVRDRLLVTGARDPDALGWRDLARCFDVELNELSR